MSPAKIVFRADDAGSSVGANEAILRTVRDGVVRNVGFMAPGPALEHAAELLRDLPDVNFGLHVTLNAEWDEVKWGPILSPSQVPSLVDDRGYFTPTPSVLQERGFSLAEAVAEVEAQLQRLRQAGIRVDYLDEHMGVGWIGGLGERLREICEREGIVRAAQISFLQGSQTQDIELLVASIRAAPEGPNVVVAHPGSDVDPVMRRFTFGGIQPGEILRERAQDRRVLSDPRLVRAVESGQIQSLTYRQATQ